MKRTSTIAGLDASAPEKRARRLFSPVSTSASSKTGSFPLLELPAEIRSIIYHHAFTPSISDINPTTHTTTLRLTYVSATSPAIRILNRKPDRIHVLRPTNFASFALTSKRLYNEVLPILAQHTTLYLSGADYDFFQTTIHPSTFVGGLLEEVVKHTPHLAIEAQVLTRSPRLQEQLVSTDKFTSLRRLTVHSCGPAEVTWSGLNFALAATDAETLLSKRTWPTAYLQGTAGSFLDQSRRSFNVPTLEGGKIYRVILKEIRDRLTSAPHHEPKTESKLKTIEVVLKLPLKSTIMSPTKSSSVTFNASEITVDFDTNTITDVSFHKIQKAPVQYRAISTALAFLDRPVTGPVRRTPRVAQASSAVSYQPQQ